MNSKKCHALMLAVLFMSGCAARRNHIQVGSFMRTSPEQWTTEPPAPKVEVPQQAATEYSKQPPAVAAVPESDLKPKPTPRLVLKKKPAPKAAKRRTKARRRQPLPAAASDEKERAPNPSEKTKEAGFPIVLLAIMPIAAALLWVIARATAHAVSG